MIIDDHKAVLDAFSSIIDKQDDMRFIAGYTKSDMIEYLFCEQKELNDTNMPDIILTDISMENAYSGIELTKKIKRFFPDIKVIAMSGFDEISYIPEAQNANADAFVSKSKPLPEFLKTIRGVMTGKKIFPPLMQIPTITGESPFSERELEVLRLLCKSYNKKEIADSLKISSGTVKRHVENMLIKSGCKTTMEMVVHVIGNGWISTK